MSYEHGSWLTLRVESSVLTKWLKIAFYLCTVLWAVPTNATSHKHTVVMLASQ